MGPLALFQKGQNKEGTNTFEIASYNGSVGVYEALGDYYELHEYEVMREDDDNGTSSSHFFSLDSSGLNVKSTFKYHELYNTENSHFTISNSLHRTVRDNDKNRDQTTFSLVDSNVELTVFDMAVPLVLNVQNDSLLKLINIPVKEYWDHRTTNAETNWIEGRTGAARKGLYLNVASNSSLRLELNQYTVLHYFNETSFENVYIELINARASSTIYVVALENVTCEEIRKFNTEKITVVYSDQIQCEVGVAYNLKKYQEEYPFDAFPALPKHLYEDMIVGK